MGGVKGFFREKKKKSGGISKPGAAKKTKHSDIVQPPALISHASLDPQGHLISYSGFSKYLCIKIICLFANHIRMNPNLQIIIPISPFANLFLYYEALV